MKRFIITTAICIITLAGYAQDSKYITSTFHVDGVCGSCKVRIENAAYIKGVKKCDWNIESGLFTVAYDSTKVDLMKIHKSIAAVGHSTDRLPADPAAYNKLPDCCKYNDGVHKH